MNVPNIYSVISSIEILKPTSGPDCSKHWIKLFTGEIIYGVIQWTTSVHWINMAVQKLSTGQKCFILDNFCPVIFGMIKVYPVGKHDRQLKLH